MATVTRIHARRRAQRAPARTPERLLSGVHYKHADGWRLWVPPSLLVNASAGQRDGHTLATQGNMRLVIGAVTLLLHHKSRTIVGTVPDSWRVDLNAGGIEPDQVDHADTCSPDQLPLAA